MRTIYKHSLPISDRVSVTTHRGAEILSVHEQDHALKVWALVENNQPKETIYFRILGTGHPADDVGAGYFVGTVVMKNGLVWHVFRDYNTVGR